MNERPYSNFEKLYILCLTILALVMLYLGYLDLQMRHHPPPNPNPYIDEIYKGEK